MFRSSVPGVQTHRKQSKRQSLKMKRPQLHVVYNTYSESIMRDTFQFNQRKWCLRVWHLRIKCHWGFSASAGRRWRVQVIWWRPPLLDITIHQTLHGQKAHVFCLQCKHFFFHSSRKQIFSIQIWDQLWCALVSTIPVQVGHWNWEATRTRQMACHCAKKKQNHHLRKGI